MKWIQKGSRDIEWILTYVELIQNRFCLAVDGIKILLLV